MCSSVVVDSVAKSFLSANLTLGLPGITSPSSTLMGLILLGKDVPTVKG